MALDVLNEAAVGLMAEFMLGIAQPAISIVYHLFVNNVTVSYATVIGDLTECTAPGYASQAAPDAGWSGSVSAGVANYTHPDLTFSMTGPGSPAQTVYGHWAEDSTTGDILWAQTWATPFAIPAGGGAVVVSPTWQDEECPP